MFKFFRFLKKKLRLIIIVLGFSSILNSVAQADKLNDLMKNLAVSNNKIISLKIWPNLAYSRISLEAEQPIIAKYFSLKQPERFVIDILHAQLNTVLIEAAQQVSTNDPIVQTIKVGQFDHDTVRIVVYTKQNILAQTNTLNPVNSAGISYKYRYLFDMYARAKSQQGLDDQLLGDLQLKINHDYMVDARRQSPQLKIPNYNLAQNKAKILIMIDPGHGGEDSGAIGPTGLEEKNVVLNIALHLKKMINTNPNLHAIMTRNSDIFIPLATRVVMARSAKADIFISIHADSFDLASAEGSSVFILSNKGVSSSFARYLAKTQNEADQIGGMTYKSHDLVVNKLLLDLTQNYTMRRSIRLANYLLKELKNINKLHNPIIERAAFAVLKAPDVPSILLESAFISNPEEEFKLKTEKFRIQVALAIYQGLNLYYKV